MSIEEEFALKVQILRVHPIEVRDPYTLTRPEWAMQN